MFLNCQNHHYLLTEENNKNNPIKGRNSDFGPFIEFDEDEEQDDFSFSGKLLEKRIELKTESGECFKKITVYYMIKVHIFASN